MSELPQGWASTDIDSVTTKPAQKIPSAEDQFFYIDIGSVDRESKKIIGPELISGRNSPSRARQVIQAGDVLVSMTRPNLNAVALVAEKYDQQIASTGFDVLRPMEIDPRWIYAAVRTKDFVDTMSDLVQGALYPAVRPRDIRAYEIPLAPAAEQKRIADKLDALLARVDATRERLDRIPTLLKRFRQSVLAAATSGQLTEDWRQEQSTKASVVPVAPVHHGSDSDLPPPKGQVTTTAVAWTEKDVQSLALVGTGSTPLRSNGAYFSSKGTPWVTSAATSQSLVTSAEEFVTEAAIKDHRLKIYPIGTLLVAMYGEGKTRGQVTELGIEAAINQACAAIIVDETKVKNAYVKFVLQANYLEMRELAEGGNQPNLNLSKIKEFPLMLPSMEEQIEIVRRVEALFALADKLEARYTTARAQVDKLTPALLAKAFRGELVPQDPNDEPAEKLLERIRVARENAPAAKKSRKSRPITERT